MSNTDVSLKRIRTVHDSIHEHMRFSAEEWLIVDHPLFQRLRWISQTGLLSLIFPSATHSRFSHSLGVVFKTEQMLRALYRESRTFSAKLYDAESARPGQAIRYYDVPFEVRSLIRRLARLCALIHDLGHGPLSHAFEAFMPRTYSMSAVLDDARLAVLQPFRRKLLMGKNDRMTHEAMSCIMFAFICQDVNDVEMEIEPWLIRAVVAVLLQEDGVDVGYAELQPWIPLVRDLITSAPVDADRMDYLLRDSKTIGVSYGLHEPERIFKSILCVRSMDHPSAYRLGWRESGLRAIEHFMMARFEMYVQIYHHKTLRAIELMLKAIRDAADSIELKMVCSNSLNTLLGNYLGLSDQRFLDRLLMGNPSNSSMKAAGKIRLICALTSRIQSRDLWKRIYDVRKGEDPETLVAHLRTLYPNDVFIIDDQALKPMKDFDRAAYLMELDDSGRYTRDPRGWFEASPVMRVLREEERSLVRIFLQTPSSVPSGAIRKTATALAYRARAQKRSLECES